ncbi:HIRAN domain-containing protein [Polaromonas sp.]|uniref:HIRAN domain-containing protein n=1 Tax=Polaromonas sp. TaxID=1869339 RepID=UPI00326453EF
MNAPAYAHWESTGTFQVAVAGTSHYRAAIESIALNQSGTAALAICLVYLEFDNQNQHDPNAVRVMVRGQMVGHLPAVYAKTYRSYLSELPPHIKHVSAAAAITGGLRTSDRAYEYSIELDIPDSLKMYPLSEPMSDEVIRANGYAPLVESSTGIFTAKVWVPTPDFNDLHKQRRVQEWTTGAWETVNFYALNRQGIGLGYKLYEIPKVQYASLFQGQPTSATLELGAGRFATLRIATGA